MNYLNYVQPGTYIDSVKYAQDRLKTSPADLLKFGVQALDKFQQIKMQKDQMAQDKAIKERYASVAERGQKTAEDTLGYTKAKDEKYFKLQNDQLDYNKNVGKINMAFAALDWGARNAEAGMNPAEILNSLKGIAESNEILQDLWPTLQAFGPDKAFQAGAAKYLRNVRRDEAETKYLEGQPAWQALQNKRTQAEIDLMNRSGGSGGQGGGGNPPRLEDSENYLTGLTKRAQELKARGASMGEFKKLYDDSMKYLLPIHQDEAMQGLSEILSGEQTKQDQIEDTPSTGQAPPKDNPRKGFFRSAMDTAGGVQGEPISRTDNIPKIPETHPLYGQFAQIWKKNTANGMTADQNAQWFLTNFGAVP